MSNDSISHKICRVCGESYEETTEFFQWRKDTKKFETRCRYCARVAGKAYDSNHAQEKSERTLRWKREHREQANETKRKWRKENPDKERVYNARWYAKNRDIKIAKLAVYRKNHIEERRAYQRQWSKTNPDKKRANYRKWQETHRDTVRQANRKWAKSHPEQVKMRSKQWRLDNPDKVTAIDQRRRAREKSVPHTFTAKDWKFAKSYFKGCCAYCLTPVEKPHQEHHIALTNNGGYTPDNILPSCSACNWSKSDKNPVQWVYEHFDNPEEVLERIRVYFDSL